MNRRPGVVLLEVMLALAILGVAGMTLLGLQASNTAAVERANRADSTLAAAGALLNAVALWPPEDLDRRLGARRQGTWTLAIQRPAPALYDVALLDSTARHLVLATTLFRPGAR